MKEALTLVMYLVFGILALLSFQSFTAGISGNNTYYKGAKQGCYNLNTYDKRYNPFYRFGCFISQERKELEGK